MDAQHFATLLRTLMPGSSRRRLLGALGTLPLLGGSLTQLGVEDAAAGRKQRCKAKSRAVVCAGTCGTVKNKQTCGKSFDCGPCACDPACGACSVCDPTSRTCVADAAQAGLVCGSAGQTCDSAGMCGCTCEECPPERQCAEGCCAPHQRCSSGTCGVRPLCHANGTTCTSPRECCGSQCFNPGDGMLVCAGCSSIGIRCLDDSGCCQPDPPGSNAPVVCRGFVCRKSTAS